MDIEIQTYLDSNNTEDNINNAVILVKKYAEINNKTIDKNLLKEDIINFLLQYVSKYKNSKDYKLLSTYVDKSLRFKDSLFQNNIIKRI